MKDFDIEEQSIIKKITQGSGYSRNLINILDSLNNLQGTRIQIDKNNKKAEFLKEVVRELASKTGALAIAATDSGEYFISGYANILDMPEFFDIDITKTLLLAIDEFECIKTLFAAAQDEDIHILMGEELGPLLSGPYGFVFKRYTTTAKTTGDIGVIGPTRLNYTYIVPTVRYFGNLIEEVARGW